MEELIPGLPNDVAELCLLHLPYPYTSLARSVSATWNKAVTSPAFLHAKKSVSLSLPYLFILAVDQSTARIHCHALDPRSGRWFLLPPMPRLSLSPDSFAVTALPSRGELFVLAGKSTVVYSTATNQWVQGKPMPNPMSFLQAAAVEGNIIALGDEGISVYESESDTWREGAAAPAAAAERRSLGVAAVGGEVCVTEGWRWPFVRSPRGCIYDIRTDTWREMASGMREGWTGVSAVVAGRLVVVAEYGDCPVKIYDSDRDEWRYAGGEKFPCAALKRPFAVTGLDGKILVVAAGLSVGIGSLTEGQNGEFSVTWWVLPAPATFRGFSPSGCQVLYA